MDIKTLRYFVAIVDYGSLTKAAEIVHVAQPALSQQLTALEAELGVQLLQRSSKGIALTSAGMVLYRHACEILRQFQITPEIKRPLSLCWLKSTQLTPAAQAVKEVVQEITQQLVKTGDLLKV